ncbi:MAG: YicC/YloC family endoribonuclease, partial [Acidaminobacteraceae bacterium]
MIRSMTGFGRGEFENEKFSMTVEMKSVNHRYNDIIVKMPKKIFKFEEFIKSEIKKHVSRGRVEVYINFEESKSESFKVVPNYAVLDEYHRAYTEIREKYGIDGDVSLSMLTKHQDALEIEFEESSEDEIVHVITESINLAIADLIDMRSVEGEKLKEDVIMRIEIINDIVAEIEKITPEILLAHKNKMIDRINEIKDEGIEFEEQRLAQEVAIFADKTNITEEVVRLKSHFKQVENIIAEGGNVGRKLDFLVQELNREVNTIGSKSPDVDISNYVVNM